MDLIGINDTIGRLTADMSLYRRGIEDVSLSTLRNYSAFLIRNQLDFQRETMRCEKGRGTEFFMHQLYYSLIEYSMWYVENCDHTAPEDVVKEAKDIFMQIECIWRPLIEELFPQFINQGNKSPMKDDPDGYNRKYGKPGEKYRSIRYDITENPDYPHLTKRIIFDRLKEIISEIPNEGADISRLISLAYKYGLLCRMPYRKSLIRELGMTCSVQSLTELITNRDDVISDSRRLESMKERLLKK
jgi:hypothetical protein